MNCCVHRHEDTTVRDLVSHFDGCSGRKAGEVAGEFLNRTASSLSRDEAEIVLKSIRAHSKPVLPGRLGYVGGNGPYDHSYCGYTKQLAQYVIHPRNGGIHAEIPCIVEAWVAEASFSDESDGDPYPYYIDIYVNRTLIVGEVFALPERTNLTIRGCELDISLASVGRAPFHISVNIITPYMPLSSSGKEPDLSYVNDALHDALKKAITAVKNKRKKFAPKKLTQKEDILALLPRAILSVSGYHRYRYSQRQLYYTIRPDLIELVGEENLGADPFNNFKKVITEHENLLGKDLPGIYRDARGRCTTRTHTRPYHSARLQLRTTSDLSGRSTKSSIVRKRGFSPS